MQLQLAKKTEFIFNTLIENTNASGTAGLVVKFDSTASTARASPGPTTSKGPKKRTMPFIPLPRHRIPFNLLRLRDHSIEPRGDKFGSNSHSRFSVAYSIFHDYPALDDVTRVWEFVLEDAGVYELSGYRADVDFAVDSVGGC